MKTKTSLSKNWGKVKTFFKNIFSKSKKTASKILEEAGVAKEKPASAFKPKFKPTTYWGAENPIWFGKNQKKRKNNHIRLSQNTRRKHRKAA
jgi:hypothetical protein